MNGFLDRNDVGYVWSISRRISQVFVLLKNKLITNFMNTSTLQITFHLKVGRDFYYIVDGLKSIISCTKIRASLSFGSVANS